MTSYMRDNDQCELHFPNHKRWPVDFDHNLLFKSNKNENNKIVPGMEKVMLTYSEKLEKKSVVDKQLQKSYQ